MTNERSGFLASQWIFGKRRMPCRHNGMSEVGLRLCWTDEQRTKTGVERRTTNERGEWRIKNGDFLSTSFCWWCFPSSSSSSSSSSASSLSFYRHYHRSCSQIPNAFWQIEWFSLPLSLLNSVPHIHISIFAEQLSIFKPIHSSFDFSRANADVV